MVRSALLMLLAVFSLCGVISADENDFIDLFDGESLNGWTNDNGEPVTKGWVAEDGMLVRKSRGGHIYAVGEYGDFELRFEWKIDTGGNSGVKYRVAFYEQGVRGKPGWLGCEYQLYGDKRPNDLGDHSAGALYDLFKPSKRKQLRGAGEFNESRIVVQGTHIEHWLNGEKLIDVDTSSDEWKQRIADSKFGIVPDFFENKRGRIQIQDHGHSVWFRNIRLRHLSSEEQLDSELPGDGLPKAD